MCVVLAGLLSTLAHAYTLAPTLLLTHHFPLVLSLPPFTPFLQLGLPCDITVSNFAAGILMYGSYFVLFALFAMGKYGAPSKAGKERKSKGKEQVADVGETEAQEPPPAKSRAANKKRA